MQVSEDLPDRMQRRSKLLSHAVANQIFKANAHLAGESYLGFVRQAADSELLTNEAHGRHIVMLAFPSRSIPSLDQCICYLMSNGKVSLLSFKR